MSLMKMVHAVDPRQELFDKVGIIDDMRIFNNWVLCAVYKRPEKMASGVYLPEDYRKEDEYQGKVGLVLKKGPYCFVDDDKYSFGDQNIEIGDWVAFRSSDGWSLTVNGVLCRMLQDIHIRLAPPTPDMVF